MSNQNHYQIAVVGAGLGGLVSAFELAQKGFKVLLLERKSLPRHKVCGEYISNEVKPLLESFGLFPQDLDLPSITQLQLTAQNGQQAQSPLALGGFGVSRYYLDQFLAQKAEEAGAQILLKTEVTNIQFEGRQFEVSTAKGGVFTADLVIGAHGKRSKLDKNLGRKFMKQKTPYVAVKQHFKADIPGELVSLHNFEGGYCGVSQVEEQRVNVCYLTTTRTFNAYDSIADYQQKHLVKNPFLKTFFAKAEPLMPKPLVISQVNFSAKPQVENHVLMVGDAAGLIHPLCGNGMAMAIHAAHLASYYIAAFLEKKMNRAEMELAYQRAWKEQFAQRLRFGRIASHTLGKSTLSNTAVRLAKSWPALLHGVSRFAHGQYISV